MDDISTIDVRKLEHSYMEATAELRSIYLVLDNLRNENDHLRSVIQVILQSKNV